MSDLRESGAIEQDADMVMFLYRPEYHGITNDAMGETIEGETHIHIAKHRNGSTGMEKVRFIKEYQKFVDMEDNRFDSFGGGNNGGGGSNGPSKDNPQAGIRRDPSEFGGSKLFIPSGFETRQSIANDVNWDDDDMGSGMIKPFKKNLPPDEDVPF